MNNDLPLVSLVTPVYNQGEFLEATLQSVLAQDYPAIEYIVIDDGSTDNSTSILEHHQPPLNWQRHANMGQAATLNKGWAKSRGVYLGYLSADDTLHPDAISTLVQTLEANPDAVVAYCDFDWIDVKGNKCGSANAPDWDYRKMYEELVCHPGPGALFRRSAFEQVGGWNPKLHRIPDFEFWLRMGRLGRFVRIPRPIADSRLHAESGGLKPITFERSTEYVRTMQAYWGEDRSPAAQSSLSRAHFKTAISHAQSGRPLAAIASYVRAVRLSPRRLVSRSSWTKFLQGFLMRIFRNNGRLASWLR